MLKYSGDLIEKLVAGAFVVVIFQEKEDPHLIAAGLILLASWIILRRKEVKGRSRK